MGVADVLDINREPHYMLEAYGNRCARPADLDCTPAPGAWGRPRSTPGNEAEFNALGYHAQIEQNHRKLAAEIEQPIAALVDGPGSSVECSEAGP